MKIGVLALQGDFAEHLAMLHGIGVETRPVRLPGQLEGLDGLIIPGGESTTIGRLATTFGLMQPLREFGRSRPMWGTCAGAIFLARQVGRDQPVLGMMDIHVARNAFGRQVDSFVTELSIPALAFEPQRPFPAVFIRAPVIEKVGKGVEVLARLAPEPQAGQARETVVACRQGRLLATAFHPELTHDARFHRYFLSLAER